MGLRGTGHGRGVEGHCDDVIVTWHREMSGGGVACTPHDLEDSENGSWGDLCITCALALH